MRTLSTDHQAKLLGYLNERLAFETTGVKLYDRILEQMKRSKDEMIGSTFDDIRKHRDEEREHAQWLEVQIRGLGGDGKTPSEMADLVTQESQGIEQVIMRDPELPHLFHALWAAELVDNAGWDLLVQLADEAKDRHAKREFKKRLHEEEDHLLLVRRIVEKLSTRDVLGEDFTRPMAILPEARL